MIYATEDGNYFFLNGDLHQTSAAGAINLTEERRAVTRKEQLAAVAVEDMVVSLPRERPATTSLYSPTSPVSIAKSYTEKWTS